MSGTYRMAAGPGRRLSPVTRTPDGGATQLAPAAGYFCVVMLLFVGAIRRAVGPAGSGYATAAFAGASVSP